MKIKHLWILIIVISCTIAVWSADCIWLAEKSGKWSDHANWKAGKIPGAEDNVIIIEGGNSYIDADFTGVIAGIVIKSSYIGTVTQERDLVVNGDLTIDGGGTPAWTFLKATIESEIKDERLLRDISNTLPTDNDEDLEIMAEDTPAKLTVKGTLNIANERVLLCPRSVTADDGRGRTIIIGKDLVINGIISADGQGFQIGPGTPKQPEVFNINQPISSAGGGYGGRGGYIGDDDKVMKGGKTYGSITAPISLGSGSPRINLRKINVPDVRGNSPIENWCGDITAGGGAITLTVAGKIILKGIITANGKSGDTGASGGSIFITSGTLEGTGIIRANGSNGPGYGWGRGPGGGGRVAVILTKTADTGGVLFQAYGGIGRFSSPAGAGTVYLHQDGKGTLIVDNAGRQPRSILEANTAISDIDEGLFKFNKIVIRNQGVLCINQQNKVETDNLDIIRNDGAVIFNDNFKYPEVTVRGKEIFDDIKLPDEKNARRIEVIACGKASLLSEEMLENCFTIAYYPSYNRLLISGALSKYPCQADIKGISSAVVTVSGRKSILLSDNKIVLNEKGIGSLDCKLPVLEDGDYNVQIRLNEKLVTAPLKFSRKRFPWEGNTLGITDKIYPPFEPLSTKENDLYLSQRLYKMNGFGLFDEIQTINRNILAEPITLKLETSKGMQTWKFGEHKFIESKPQVAVYQAEASTEVLKVFTRNTTEFDGCSKIEMDLLPGEKTEEVKNLWLEISLKDSEVPLFHNSDFEGMRRDYSGATPRGGKIVWGPFQNAWVPPAWSVEKGTEGQDNVVIWNAADTRPWRNPTVNYFVPYIWLGAQERGLAWFAANDKGWIQNYAKPAQEIIRDGNKVVLRIYLINKPTTVTSPSHIVFGMQASPTRPMLKNWRTVDYQGDAPWGPMSPLGARYCSDKYPIDNDFSLVDKWLAEKKKKEPDYSLFKKKADDLLAKDVWPAPYTQDDWMKRWNIMGSRTGMSLYFEEHWTNPIHEEYNYFKDEWCSNSMTFSRSYLDFCAYYANEFMKRGFSLYFDNTYLKTSFNMLVNDAYTTDDGKVQPACTIWEQRAYYRRIWNILNDLNEKNPEFKLKYIQHMTNALILPTSTWATSTMDNEWAWLDNATGRNPAVFPPEVLLTEMTGRQTGTQGNAFHPIGAFDYHATGPVLKKTPITPALARREWGMRMVHEIRRDNPDNPCRQEEILRDFGYGKSDVRIMNYWEEKVPVTVTDSRVKWLAMQRDKKPIGAIVLQSYTEESVKTKIKFPGVRYLVDIDTREIVELDVNGNGEVTIPEDFGTRVMLAGNSRDELPVASQVGTILSDDFEMGLNAMWGGLPKYFTLTKDTVNNENHVMTILPSREPGGPCPVGGIRSDMLAKANSFELSFRMRLSKLPVTANERGMIFISYANGTIGADDSNKKIADEPEDDPDMINEPRKPAKKVNYAISIDVNTLQGESTWAMNLLPFNPIEEKGVEAGGFWKYDTRYITGGRTGNDAVFGNQLLGTPDTEWHKFSFKVVGSHHILSIDDKVYLDAESDAVVTPLLRISTVHGGHFTSLDIDDVAIISIKNE